MKNLKNYIKFTEHFVDEESGEVIEIEIKRKNEDKRNFCKKLRENTAFSAE